MQEGLPSDLYYNDVYSFNKLMSELKQSIEKLETKITEENEKKQKEMNLKK